MISARDVYKSFRNGSVRALRGVSVDIEDGQFAVILGASGSGKSTLLSVLSGLERADGGSVFCAGQDLSAMTDKQLTAFRRENVGFVFQQCYLFENLTVESNIRLGADLAKNADYKDIAAAVGLADKLKCKPFELSGGERQRVCIACALSKKPKILFADEPTGALDEKTGRAVLDCIAKLRREYGFTLAVVTHNKNISETADVVITMNSGLIAGTEFNLAPKTAFEIGW